MKLEILKLRVYLEGVEVPGIAITVSMRRDSPATAQIQIVATPLARSIMPRTLVHVFYLDDTMPESVVGAPGGTATTQVSNQYETPGNLPAGSDQVVPNVPEDMLRYRLLFVGEVIGLEYQKGTSSRSVVLTCLDLSNYWDSVMHDRRDGIFPPTRMNNFQGNSHGSFWDLLGGDTGALYSKLEQPPDCFPELGSDPVTGRRQPSYLGGVMHLMEEVFGTYHRRITVEGEGKQVIGSQNPFAGIAELRLRLLQQCGLPPGDSTPMALLRQQGFGSIWRRSVRGLPQQFSFRTLMQALFQYTFYSVFPLSTPKYVPPQGKYAVEAGWATEQADDLPQAAQVVPFVRNKMAILERGRGDIIALFPRTTITDLEFNSIERYFMRVVNVCGECMRQLETDAARWSTARAKLRDLQAWGKEGRTTPYVTATNVLISTLNEFLEKGKTKIEEVLNALSTGGRRRPATTGDRPSFLYTQMFRPDIWFCPPPRCNVLFPEMYGNVSMGRNFLAEPTRLMIKSYEAWSGETIFWDDWYFAPTAVGLLRNRPVIRRSGGSIATGDSQVANDLMNHEIYTGIIPSFQKMSDREMTIGKNIMTAGANDSRYEGQALDYFQRVTNFLFFQSRFSNRTLNVTGIFNPYPVPGMPFLVIDGGTDARNTELNERLIQFGQDELARSPGLEDAYKSDVLDLLRGRTGVHYLGVLESITHMLDANGGGQTSYTVTYCRDHRESVELFGQDIMENRRARPQYRTFRRKVEEVVIGPYPEDAVDVWAPGRRLHMDDAVDVNTRYVTERTRITEKEWTVAALHSPQVDGLGPWGGKLIRIEDITDQFEASAETPPERAREQRDIDDQLRLIDEELGDWSSTHPADAVGPAARAAEEEKAALVDRRASLVRRRSALRSGAVSRVRNLSLFGAYPDGRRLPQANIPSNLIGVPHPASAFGPDVVSYVGSADAMVTVRAYKIVEDITELGDTVDLPIEDVVKPPWYPAIWQNGKIGGAVYLPLLGTTAITDPLAVVEPGGLGEQAGINQEDVDRLYQSPRGPDGSTGEVVGSILDGATIEGAVDFLVHTYSKIRQEWDATEFARQYTYRLVASMFDIFGSADLEIESNGKIIKGIAGFHSHAFGPYSDLFGIAPGDTIKLLGIEEGDVAARARLDVRGRRHALALAYQQELVDRVQRG